MNTAQWLHLLQIIGNILIVAAALECWAFVVLYQLTARWWESETGWYLQVSTFTFGLLLTLSAVRVVSNTAANAPWFVTLRLVVFAAIPIMFGWLIAVMLRAQLRDHRVHDERNGKEPSVRWTMKLDLDKPQPSQPLLKVGAITAAAAAVIALLVAFHVVHFDDGQTKAILGLVAILAPVVVALVGRLHVFSPATVKEIVLAERARHGVAANKRPTTKAPLPQRDPID